MPVRLRLEYVFLPCAKNSVAVSELISFGHRSFRADIARAGASANVQELVDELRRLSPEFEMMWRENDVRTHGGGTKHFRHPVAGLLAVEYSAFSIDGRPDLSLVIYNPATPAELNKMRGLLKSEAQPNRGGVATHER